MLMELKKGKSRVKSADDEASHSSFGYTIDAESLCMTSSDHNEQLLAEQEKYTEEDFVIHEAPDEDNDSYYELNY